jgi:pilus assembly protein CpaB
MNLPKGAIYIALAVVTGLVATVSIHRYVAMKTRVVARPNSQVLVAAADISPGTPVSPGNVKSVDWPRDLVPPDAPTSYEAVKDRIVVVPLSPGELVLLNKLAPEGTAAGLGGLLTDGQRAMTVRVDDVSGVAGFIKPGDHVDVLMSLPMPQQKEEQFSKTFLQNIVVLTTGQIWEQQQKDQKPVVVTTVTLEVAPEQGEVLNLVSNQGKIRLALRSRSNQTLARTSGVATSSLVTPQTPKPVVSRPAAPIRVGIEIIKGMDKSKADI